MKQISLALIQYEQDFDEQTPCSNDAWGQGWAGKVYPYVKSGGAYGCPDDPTQPASGLYKVSYGINANLLPPNSTFQGGQTTNAIAAQSSPAATVAFFEIQGQTSGSAVPGIDVTSSNENSSASGTGSISGGGGGLDSRPTSNNFRAVYATGNIGGYPLTNWNGTTGRHTDGANYAALDGHVKWLRPDAVSGGLTASASTNVEVHNTADNQGFAAGTSSLTQQNGARVAMTFSPN